MLFILYEFINTLVVHQEVAKARLESKTIYYFREYLAKMAPYIKVKHDKNVSFFACTPAYTTNQVAKLIRQKEKFYVKQVSDRWRNPNDKPNIYELEAIDFFKTHPKAKEFWQIHNPHVHIKDMGAEGKHIFYAYPLWTEKPCLLCHGRPYKDVPEKLYKLLVKDYGDRAFNYKVGELRGIISIRIPYQGVQEKINNLFLIIGGIILIMFLLGTTIFFLLYRNINKDLFRLIEYFKGLIKDNKYKQFKERLHYKEFNFLKDQINHTISVIKKYQVELKKKLYLHPLTKLHNRAKFLEYVTAHKNVPIVLINVDKFREINSVLGIELGDELIKQIANRLKELRKKYKFHLFHLDIDEFALIPKENFSKEELEEYVKKIIDKLEEPYNIQNNEIAIRFRSGVSFYSKDYVSAEMALSRTKDLKKDIVFDEKISDIKENYKDNIKWLKKLKWAIENNKIVPFYQPIVDKNKNIVKHEALVRMIDENNKVISPFFFLDIAKKSRLYNEITKIMLDRVIENIQKGHKISINLSLEDIEEKSIRDYILEKLKKCEKRYNLTIEIVENEDVRESYLTKEFLEEVKRLGTEVYIDDFGSGYANFDYLLKLNPDGVKIDGSLIKDILNNKNNEIIVKTIINFAKETNIKVIAEFVENKEIFEKLKSLDVDYFQGYYFSPPTKEIKDKL
jgi:diguanylate cyclase (GGDEF)-like protein